MGNSLQLNCCTHRDHAEPVQINCCVQRDPMGHHSGRECCDLNTSLLGEDAFYREAYYYDCDEGDKSKDSLFAACALEQGWLKFQKVKAVTQAARAELKRKLSWRSTASDRQQGNKGRIDLKRPDVVLNDTNWHGNTITEWIGSGNPSEGGGPFWSKGRGEGLMVRHGPNYVRNKSKAESECSMYEAISCDAIKTAKGKIENIIGRLVEKLPPAPDMIGGADCGGGQPRWEKGCPPPRVICINMMLPYGTGISPWEQDTGCSMVGFFHIRPETLQAVTSDQPPPWIQLFQDFFNGPAGAPGGQLNDPKRCLSSRQKKGVKKDMQSGLFKAVAFCENPADVHIPEAFHKFNGKPCLITKSGYVMRDPEGEWLEIGVDVRRFNLLARKCLKSFRERIPHAKIHYGFWVQATGDEEMPERLLCDVYCSYIDIEQDPVVIPNDTPFGRWLPA